MAAVGSIDNLPSFLPNKPPHPQVEGQARPNSYSSLSSNLGNLCYDCRFQNNRVTKCTDTAEISLGLFVYTSNNV